MLKNLRVCAMFFCMIFCIAGQSFATGDGQAPKVEPRADQILKQMSDYLKNLKQFTVTAQTSYESILDDGEKITYLNQAEIVIKRPNRLYIHRTGMIRDQEYFYDGKTFTVYGRNKNLYASAQVPPTLDQMLEYATDVLNLPAPGNDLFYSDVYEGLMSDVISGIYVGKNKIDGVLCHHLAYRGSEVDWQIWIQDGEEPLPRLYIITSKWITGAPEYSMAIRKWDVGKEIPDKRFHFVPPKGATKIRFLTAQEVESVKRKIKEGPK